MFSNNPFKFNVCIHDVQNFTEQSAMTSTHDIWFTAFSIRVGHGNCPKSKLLILLVLVLLGSKNTDSFWYPKNPIFKVLFFSFLFVYWLRKWEWTCRNHIINKCAIQLISWFWTFQNKLSKPDTKWYWLGGFSKAHNFNMHWCFCLQVFSQRHNTSLYVAYTCFAQHTSCVTWHVRFQIKSPTLPSPTAKTQYHRHLFFTLSSPMFTTEAISVCPRTNGVLG